MIVLMTYWPHYRCLWKDSIIQRLGSRDAHTLARSRVV
jgi:hypothetical protein